MRSLSRHSIVMVGLLLSWVLLGLAEAADPAPSPRIVGYFAEWNVYEPELQVSRLRADQITHINYAFAKISKDGLCEPIDRRAALERIEPSQKGQPDAPRGNLAQLVLLKRRNPKLEILISIGGWTQSGEFSNVALTPESRKKFSTSCVDFLAKHNLDGIDLDWEYPTGGGLASNTARPEDKPNFTLLLAELRRQLDAKARQDGRAYRLTIATPAGQAAIRRYEMDQIAPLLDWVNVMTYDMAGEWSAVTSHLAPLDASATDPANRADRPSANTVKASLASYKAQGFPADKIVMGVPFYGHSWIGVAGTNHGLHQKHASRRSADRSAPPASIDYRVLMTRFREQDGYSRFWDAEARAPWLYNPKKQVMISYEDPESLRAKARHVLENGYGGCMIWELGADDPQGTLLRTLNQELRPNSTRPAKTP